MVEMDAQIFNPTVKEGKAAVDEINVTCLFKSAIMANLGQSSSLKSNYSKTMKGI